MKIVSVHEAKTHLSRLIREVEEGQEIVIARGRMPLVRLVLLEPSDVSRRLGTARDVVKIHDDFDEPLPDFDDYG